MDDKKGLAHLAGLIAGVNENSQQLLGEVMVLTSAVSALVRSHPDPDAFASAMRRAWMQAGQLHSSSEAAPTVLLGIDQSLSVLEGASRVPLHLRSPAAASPLDD